MLSAYNEQQQLFLPYQYSREALQRFRQQMKFYCPQCLQPVQLKIGEYNIPHFAHNANNSCVQLFSEGESKLHLQGKIQLFEWLRKLGHTVKLEPYLPNLSQRPDVLLIKEQKQIAIEFQCSSISHEKWQLRTSGYEKNSIQPLWLFQTPQRQSTQGIQKIFIAPIMQKMITTTAQGLSYLVTYDAKVSRFIYWTNLLHVHGHTFIGKVQELTIHKQHLPFYVPTSITKEEFRLYWQLYKKQCKQFVYQRLLHSKKGARDSFLRSSYELRFALTAMPDYVGVPVKDAEAIPLFPIEWQTILHHYCRGLQLLPHELSEREIRLFLLQQNIEITDRAVQAIENYGMVLAKSYQKNDYFPDIYEQVYAHLFAIATIY
ncbi:competence protein CoiA family protein [Lysinibacillus sp. fls2-241-R2A-57]|uniref:competence protein CoiA n=1 Tax=Lysinibacillus sp. fls2-241-R2A-57 TaxID=3040292 RepID=UPI002555DB17|nr:competence protein CoiA family protein [Lysinibacillus sp. fls2-241-R2A-57]